MSGPFWAVLAVLVLGFVGYNNPSGVLGGGLALVIFGIGAFVIVKMFQK